MKNLYSFVRYVNLLAVLFFCLKLFAITQEGPMWEVPSYVFDKEGELYSIISTLLILEVVLVLVDYLVMKRIAFLARVMYMISLTFCFWAYIFSFNNFIFSLRGTQPFISMLIAKIIYWGFPLSCLLVVYLTIERIKGRNLVVRKKG